VPEDDFYRELVRYNESCRRVYAAPNCSIAWHDSNYRIDGRDQRTGISQAVSKDKIGAIQRVLSTPEDDRF
jgi:hypothetical protein